MCPSLKLAFLVATLYSHTWGAKDVVDDGKNIDIREALNTTEPLWLLWQTYRNGFSLCMEDKCINENEICIRNMMINISDKDYYFTEKMIVEGQEDATNYVGTFKDGMTPPKSMEVFEVTDTTVTKEITGAGVHELWTLEFWHPRSRCMVFFISQLDNVIRDDVGTCEMYTVGKPAGADPPADCKVFFQNNCNMTRVYTPYTADCHKI
uniref:Lipocalin/cytosolic fatty-acid binding domain-containing protein n=1 Tax=Amblyomma maculatum TaxID=34609 RepID=G3MKG3_AMBMU